MKLQNLLQRADVTRTGSYHFEESGEKVVKFPDRADDILDSRAKFERLIVEARGEVDLALQQYNALIDDYNLYGQQAAEVLKDKYGMLAHPALKPKLDLAGPEAHGTAPPNIPQAYKDATDE